MKKILVVIAICMPFFSIAHKEITSFEKIMNVLKNAKEVQALFYYKECQLISDNEIATESIDAIGGMSIDTWEYFEKGAVKKKAFVVTSSTKLIANPIGEGFVYN